VPTVGDLHRIRGAEAGALGVGTGPITADDLHAWMSAQPGRQHRRSALGQQIQRAPGARIDDHRAVMVTATKREVVHPDHGRVVHRRVGQCPQQAQEAVPAGSHAEHVGQPGPGAPTKRDRDRRQHPDERGGSAGMTLRQIHWLLDERAARASRVVAEEPAHRQSQRDRSARDRSIAQRSSIPTVHPCRSHRAGRAGTVAGPQARVQDQPGPPVLDREDGHRIQVREQPAEIT
jgi:hypothetical protein